MDLEMSEDHPLLMEPAAVGEGGRLEGDGTAMRPSTLLPERVEGEAGDAQQADAGVPLVNAGEDPGYLIPQDIAALGLANDAERVDKWTSSLTGGQLSALRSVGGDCFSDDEFKRGVMFIDSTSTSESQKYIYDNFQDFLKVAGQANRLATSGTLSVRYPWAVSTDTVEGPTKLSYTVTNTISNTHSETDGYSVGGSLKVSIGGIGDPSFSGSYTHSSTNSTTWTSTGAVGSDLTAEKKQWGRIDLFKIGGTYEGYLFFVLHGLPVDAADHRYRVFYFDGNRFRCTAGLIAFPIKNFFIKSPDSPSPSERVQRHWADGEKPPGKDFPAS
ncbi:hypothetical protein [Streptacidiphilus sp. P02-A3a]|uniref:hypothetical protein n=1 Tax=Streptacidiphilus sp. P02-A3a TaxID=2704468 RepID=UPI0015FD1281|nr:hypothetical protein [Streptacidiphilus sp. P02-A3a]QMU69685.1 hypothetical protein GXP74_17000 [Streptacidiphilus sp. P02-A3a]